MREIIENLIRDIKIGIMFDSHFIIDTLIRNHSDDYFRFVADYIAGDNVTERAHGQIAKMIASFQDELVNQLENKSISYNIRGNPSKCALWERI